jgi:hypothetical protein
VNEIPDLWGGEISISALSPVSILRSQDELLRRKTKGALTAEVRTRKETDGPHTLFVHTMDLSAPILGYSETILEASHRENFPYPVVIDLSEELRETTETQAPRPTKCFEPDEFMRALGNILSSQPVRSVIASLIARSNDVKPLAEIVG